MSPKTIAPGSRWRRGMLFTAAVLVTVTVYASVDDAASQESPTVGSVVAINANVSDPGVAALTSAAQSQDDEIEKIEAPEIDAADGSPLHWFDDYESARDIARRAKKPMFVVIRCER